MKLTRAQAKAAGIPAEMLPKRSRRAKPPVVLRGERQALIFVRLPWPPSVNHYLARGKNGVYKTKGAKAYTRAVAEACLEQGIGHVVGRLDVSIGAYPPNESRTRDLDNVLKAAIDSLMAAGVFADDSQIDLIRIERHWAGDGVLAVRIVSMTQEA